MTHAIPLTEIQAPRDVWIVFSDHVDLPWLKILKSGFRHCFALIHDGNHWIAIDPMSHYLDVSILPVDGNYDLPIWMAGQGLNVVRTTPNRAIKTPAPIGFLTCVTVIKRFLGIRSRRVITPWHLYAYLQKQSSFHS